MKKAFIYKIQNLENGKMYIGSSTTPKSRWNQHTNQLKKNKHHSTYLQNSWNKYGEDMFEFVVIDECEVEIQFTREREWVIKEQTHLEEWGYNMCIPEPGGGYANTESHKQIKREISQKIYQQKKEQGLYRVVVIDLVTNEREYFDTIKECPIKFHTYYNFAVAKCYFNTNTCTREEIEDKVIKTKIKYQNYLESQQSRPIFIYKKNTKEFVGKYNSISDAARQLSISCKNLSGVLNRNACNSVKGYVPSYTQIHSSTKTHHSSNSIAFT